MSFSPNQHFNTKHGHNGRYKDGKPTYSPTHTTWQGMKQRCDYPKNIGYKNYGGRGIFYDPSWKDFEVFLLDMGERPIGTSLDRIDRNGPYTKDNCRWASALVQAQNSSAFKHGCGSTVGGKKTTKEFRAWMNCRSVCKVTNTARCTTIAALGITVDKRWDSFTTFLDDVGHAPSDKHRFVRLDKTKHYNKENCAWVLKEANENVKR